MNGALDHSDQPDPDAIKMFVGQIPRSWSEKELKELFEPYGAVYQINVLRDRSQNPPQSKGTDRWGGVGVGTGWGGGGRAVGGAGAGGVGGGRRALRGCPAPQGGRTTRGAAAATPGLRPAGLLPAPAPAPPPRRTGGPSRPGTRGREEWRERAAAPLSRRVIALPRSLPRRRRL